MNLRIAADEIHLWLIDLDLAAAEVDQLRRLLSPEELEAERRFHFWRDRRRLVTAHGALRTILGGYLHQLPERVAFVLETNGKPYLKKSDNPDGLSFNLSHSRELALIGVCRCCSIGVDIEYRDSARATDDTAQRFFACEELSAFTRLKGQARSDAFFQTWTRKESYLKARGEGVALGLDTFAVVGHADGPPTLVRSAHESDLHQWHFWDLALHLDYAAAMAVQGPGHWKVRQQRIHASCPMGRGLAQCEKVFPMLPW